MCEARHYYDEIQLFLLIERSAFLKRIAGAVELFVCLN